MKTFVVTLLIGIMFSGCSTFTYMVAGKQKCLPQYTEVKGEDYTGSGTEKIFGIVTTCTAISTSTPPCPKDSIFCWKQEF